MKQLPGNWAVAAAVAEVMMKNKVTQVRPADWKAEAKVLALGTRLAHCDRRHVHIEIYRPLDQDQILILSSHDHLTALMTITALHIHGNINEYLKPSHFVL